MKAYKKLLLFFISILAVVACGYAIQKVLPPATQTEIIATKTNSTSNEEQLIPTASIYSQTATVEYHVSSADLQEYFNPDHPPREPVDNKPDSRAKLSILVIYAIDKDRVFLGGSLFFPQSGDAQRSVLLRSSDGGKHWTEVMPTTRVSEVEHIVFLDHGQGWALVSGIGEFGDSWPVMLWRTDDFGETWRIAGKIRTGTGTSIVHKTLQFYSSTNGELRLTCGGLGMCGDSDYYSILSTQDGGITWQESYHLPLPFVEGDPGHEKLLTAFTLPKGGRYGSHTGDCYSNNIQECPSYGQDGSEWQAEYSQDGMNLFVRQRLPFDSEWTTYVLSTCVEYRQGKMMDACKD